MHNTYIYMYINTHLHNAYAYIHTYIYRPILAHLHTHIHTLIHCNEKHSPVVSPVSRILKFLGSNTDPKFRQRIFLHVLPCKRWKGA